MKFTGLQTPTLQSDLANVSTQRVGPACHLHLTCSRTRRLPQTSSSVARSSSCRRDPAQSDTRTRKHCLGHSSSKPQRRSSVQNRAVADELREAVAQNGSEAPASDSAQTPTEQPKAEAASTDIPSTSSAEQSAPSQSTDAAAQVPPVPQQDTATSSATPVQPAMPQKAAYRGFKNMRHNSFQKGPDSQARIDLTSTRGSRAPSPIPVPPEEADWLLPGRTVVAKVVYSNPNGFKVEMLNDIRVGG